MLMVKAIKNTLEEARAAKEAREGRKLSIRGMAREAGCSKHTIRAWRSNNLTRVKFETLLTLADYFEVDPLSLLKVVETEEDDI